MRIPLVLLLWIVPVPVVAEDGPADARIAPPSASSTAARADLEVAEQGAGTAMRFVDRSARSVGLG